MTPPENDVHPPDDVCAACNAPLDEEEMAQEGTLAFEGFCCEACKKGEGVVNSLTELCHYVGGERLAGLEDITALSRVIYKSTSCGAFCELLKGGGGGVVVGSIVEGVDHGTQNHELPYPFRIERFWEAINDVETEAQEIWDSTHGCDQCGEENPETGYIEVNPDCKGCGGEGTVI